jgi:hypothetical protein
MNQLALEFRVKRLREHIESLIKDPDHKFTLEVAEPIKLSQIRAKDYFPPDMLMILDQIGCMRNWGHRDFAMIDWWVPSSIECSMAEDRSIHELHDSNFKNPYSLLFFASDCDAKCYFYDITGIPWKVVVCDGLDLSIFNNNPKKYHLDWDGRVNPWEEAGSNDAISIIERWVFMNG